MQNNSNDVRWFPGPYFTVRHDPRLGFAPPAVQLLAPADGQSFPGGGIVPIAWSAGAAEGLRSFGIQVSTDGGLFWRMLVAELPAEARSYDWRLPPSDSGIADVRVRVIARDRRFQNSSDGGATVFSIVPGSGAIVGDLDGDGDVDLEDYGIWEGCTSGPSGGMRIGCEPADLDRDGDVDLIDFASFQEAFGQP